MTTENKAAGLDRASLLGSIAHQGAINGRAIAKSAVFYTLGAALFCAQNAKEAKPIARKDRKAAYEAADHGRATERHWLLGVTLAKECADAVAETLAGLNSNDGAIVIDKLADMIISDAAAAGVEITNGKAKGDGRLIIWSKLDAYISTGKAAVAKTALQRIEAMGKAMDKLSEDTTPADARAAADAMERDLLAKVKDTVRKLRAMADAMDRITDETPTDEQRAAFAAVERERIARETTERLAA